MTTFAVAVVIGFVLGLIIGWAVGHAQPKPNEGVSLGGVTKIIGAIYGAF